MNELFVPTLSLRMAMASLKASLPTKRHLTPGGGFDRTAYQKEYMRGYMRRYRAAEKSAKGPGGRPRLEDVGKTLEATKPWLTGEPVMSRRTYFSRKAEATVRDELT